MNSKTTPHWALALLHFSWHRKQREYPADIAYADPDGGKRSGEAWCIRKTVLVWLSMITAAAAEWALAWIPWWCQPPPPRKLDSVETPNLDKMKRCWVTVRGLVQIFASWCWVGMKLRLSKPSMSFWRTKRQSNSICLVRSWKTGFLAIYIAAKLSHLTRIGVIDEMVNSARSLLSHVSSAVTPRRLQYSASAEDNDTVTCFLAGNQCITKENDKTTHKPASMRASSPISIAIGQ